VSERKSLSVIPRGEHRIVPLLFTMARAVWMGNPLFRRSLGVIAGAEINAPARPMKSERDSAVGTVILTTADPLGGDFEKVMHEFEVEWVFDAQYREEASIHLGNR
jgi:hypothetical protein